MHCYLLDFLMGFSQHLVKDMFIGLRCKTKVCMTEFAFQVQVPIFHDSICYV